MGDQFLPVLITLTAAAVFAVILLGTAALLGTRTRRPSARRGDPYESGVPLLDRARKRISVKFYLVALVFVVLDVEVAFLYPWALTYRQALAAGSTAALYDMLAFLLLLAVVYLYLWRKGIFDWGRRPLPGARGGRGR